jgi:23S rRNA (guanine745-N1)-methyltransferase
MIADDDAGGSVVPPAYRCPHCSLALAESATVFECGSGHVFDRAREGYVNLLPGGRLAGGPSGDDDAMVRARRAVFDRGAYDPIIDAVGAVVADLTSGRGAPRVLDVGCGEGTYLARASTAAGGAGWGIDISKAACRLAARRAPGLHVAVASNHRLPFDSGPFDVVINVFAPRDFPEMLRVLRPGGAAVVVTPGPHHLAQLKALVYDTPRAHRDDEPTPAPPDSVTTVQFTVQLPDPQLRRHLLEMTPYWWSASPERRAVVEAALHSVDAEMLLAVYRR